jgi:hypothetical protein
MGLLMRKTGTFILFGLAASATAQNTTKAMLDSIARMVDGSLSGIDDDFFNELVDCMSQATNLVESHDAAWAGFKSYYLTNGTDDDAWGACSEEAGCPQYQENNLTAMDVDGIGIYEPCNSASNLAYYHTAIGVCQHEGFAMDASSQQALVEAYVALSMGSYFWHGSHSFLGNVADNRLIDVLSFISYQVSIQNFLTPDGNQTEYAILRDLNTTLRHASAVDQTQELTDMFITTNVDTWQAYFSNLDMPDYYLTFAALVVNVFNLIMTPDMLMKVFQVMASAFNLPEEYVEFMEQSYIPTLQKATNEKQISLNSVEKTTLAFKMTGVMVKLFYAFLWQEWVFTFGPEGDLMYRPRVNELGAYLMPGVNTLANMLTGYVHTEPNVQDCVDVYPADARCRVEESHSKWHEEGGNGLLDLMFISDDIFSVTSNAMHHKPSNTRSMLNGGKKLITHHVRGFGAFAVKTVKGYSRYISTIMGLNANEEL